MNIQRIRHRDMRAVSTAIVMQVARAVRPAIAVVVVILTLWAMPGLEPGNRDIAAHVAIAVTR